MRVEPELAFILGRDLPARDEPYIVAEIDAAISDVHLALELIDSRYCNPAEADFAEDLADGLRNQGLFIGPQVDRKAARATRQMSIHVSTAVGQETRPDGCHPNADPLAPLDWLAEFLRNRGDGLRAGQAVITGSYAGRFEVPVDQDVTVRFGSLGELVVRFGPQ